MIGTLIGLAVGAVAGAFAALLFAPASGRETQQRIRRGAERGWEEAKTGYDKALSDMSKTMDEGLGEVKSQIARIGKKAG